MYVLGQLWSLEVGQVYETRSGRLWEVVSIDEEASPIQATFRNYGTGQTFEDTPNHFLIGVEVGYYHYKGRIGESWATE